MKHSIDLWCLFLYQARNHAVLGFQVDLEVSEDKFDSPSSLVYLGNAETATVQFIGHKLLLTLIASLNVHLVGRNGLV